jgi:hypothetical protein
VRARYGCIGGSGGAGAGGGRVVEGGARGLRESFKGTLVGIQEGWHCVGEGGGVGGGGGVWIGTLR